jgi:hypothetical protein
MKKPRHPTVSFNKMKVYIDKNTNKKSRKIFNALKHPFHASKLGIHAFLQIHILNVPYICIIKAKAITLKNTAPSS